MGICPKCDKVVRWYHRKWRLIQFDYVAYHWECRDKNRKTATTAEFRQRFPKEVAT